MRCDNEYGHSKLKSQKTSKLILAYLKDERWTIGEDNDLGIDLGEYRQVGDPTTSENRAAMTLIEVVRQQSTDEWKRIGYT